MFVSVVVLILGFILLIKGADLLVSGASSIARRYGVSNIVIGLTIVAFGTSLPELVINLVSGSTGNSEIAIGNVLGSNIANVLLILGVSAMICPLVVHKNTVWKELPLSVLASIVLLVLVNDAWFGYNFNELSSGDGVILLTFFVIFLYYTFGLAKKGKTDVINTDEDIKEMVIWKAILFIIIGIAGLALGGNWTVESAVDIATEIGLSEAVIGLTIVAIGTSLPELATSAIAATKKQTDIAIGNVVGSNIFNIFWILGLSSVVSPIPFNTKSNIDLLLVVLSSGLLFSFLFIGKKHHLQKWQGLMFVVIYVSYLAVLVMR